MNPDIPTVPDNPFPEDIDESSQGFIRLAAEAEKRGAWKEAIAAYQALLKKNPGNLRVRMSLGKAYEGISRIGEERAFLLLAMEQYRLALRLDPHLMEANEALLSTAYRADSLDELLSEYRLRYKSDPNNALYQDFVRKAETLLSLPKKYSRSPLLPVGRFVAFLVSRILPAASILSFFLALIFASRPHTFVSSALADISFRMGFCLSIMYLLCWILIHRS